jgi:hypothetical protein
MCEESLGFLYTGCCRLLHNLDMCQKPLAYFGLHIGMVPMAYHCALILNHKAQTQTKQAQIIMHCSAQGGEASKCDPSSADKPADDENGQMHQECNSYVKAAKPTFRLRG